MTGAEFHSQEIKRREEKKEARKEQHIKSEKLLTLTSKITEHDLNSKIAKCVKWIEKLHEIRVSISADDSEKQKSDKIVAAIEEGMKPVAGRILQKRTKDGMIKFSIMPTLKKETKEKPAENPSASDTSASDTPASITPAQPDKKLLEPDASPDQVQRARSIHTMAL